jgi:hypothetical protein
MYSSDRLEEVFPMSERYRALLGAGGGELREGGPRRALAPCSERQLQCVWYNPELRPKRLLSSEGEELRVLDPGRWNLESGPDFIGAVLETVEPRRRLTGDVEIHIDPGDWLAHGHQSDPNYDAVCAHVSYFNAPLPEELLPPGAVQISLKKSLLSNPYFAFEDIDVSAYPYDIRKRQSPCAKIIADWDRPSKEALLQAAGEERLRRKSEEFQNLADESGLEQALYGRIMRALGYKSNASAFGYIAAKLPVAALRNESEADPLKAYALLMGVGGMLPREAAADWDRATRAFHRRIWDNWWRARARWETVVMDAQCWKRGGMRPQNRVERRLMAAAALFADSEPIDQRWAAFARRPARDCVAGLTRSLRELDGDYWARRLAWSGRVQENDIALIGSARAGAIAANAFVPFAVCIGAHHGTASEYLECLPREALNATVRECANLFFGPSHPPSLYKGVVRRQGLIQIFQDFCLADRSGCRECDLPGMLARNWSG